MGGPFETYWRYEKCVLCLSRNVRKDIPREIRCMWEDNCKIDLKQQGLNNVGGGGGGGHRDIGNYLQKDTAWYHRTFYSLSKIFV